MSRMILCALVAVAVGWLVGPSEIARANDPIPRHQQAWHQTAPPLFANYYVPPHAYGGVGAQLYVSPLPVPPHVGHTYITYQPFMPHEYMYRHHRTYYRWHDRGGNYTRVQAYFW
jgi:hypothetical protein